MSADKKRSRGSAAFFDFDGTLIDGFSALAFLRDRAARRDLPAEEALMIGVWMTETSRGRTTFDDFMRKSCRSFRGQDEASLSELGDRLYDERLSELVYPAALARLRDHQDRGDTVVLATSALPFQVEPFARHFDIAHVLCTRLELQDGICTGRIAGRVVFGQGKVAAVTAFAAQHSTDLDASFAYGNGDEDIPFLSAVGNPNVVNPQPELERMAYSEGWPIHRFTLNNHRGPLTRVAGIARLARNLGAATATTLGPD